MLSHKKLMHVIKHCKCNTLQKNKKEAECSQLCLKTKLLVSWVLWWRFWHLEPLKCHCRGPHNPVLWRLEFVVLHIILFSWLFFTSLFLYFSYLMKILSHYISDIYVSFGNTGYKTSEIYIDYHMNTIDQCEDT